MMKITPISLAMLALVLFAGTAKAQVSEEVLNSISTPNEVKTSIGTLKFLDGAPFPETSEKVYDYLDTARAMDSFLIGQPACSLKALIDGAHSIGAVERPVAIALNRMDVGTLIHHFGRRPRSKPALVYQSIMQVWIGTIYGHDSLAHCSQELTQ